MLEFLKTITYGWDLLWIVITIGTGFCILTLICGFLWSWLGGIEYILNSLLDYGKTEMEVLEEHRNAKELAVSQFLWSVFMFFGTVDVTCLVVSIVIIIVRQVMQVM